MGLHYQCHIKDNGDGVVRTIYHSNFIERLWSTLKYYVKYVYNTIPGDGVEEAHLMESIFRRRRIIAQIDREARKDYIRQIYKL